PLQAELTIKFLVIGGGIAGLACAIALRRVGHRVVVLEQYSQADIDNSKMSHGGIQLPPNVSKVLYHWGLEHALRQVSITSSAIEVKIYETGEFIGKHYWKEEVLRETGGDFLFLHHASLRQVLYDTAIAAGAEVRAGTTAVSVSGDGPRVTLTTGETLLADVIVGADGHSSIVQQAIVGKDVIDAAPYQSLFYNTTVPGALMRADPQLAPFFKQPVETMFVWLGNNRSTVAFRMGGKDEFALHLWVRPMQKGLSDDDCWGGGLELKDMQRQLGECEPKLLKITKLAATPACVQVKMVPPIEDWVDEHGRMVIIGEAAHPLPAGSLQGGAMAVEDAAVFAKLFSHLRNRDQISTFLHAFQDLREDRCASVMHTEQCNLYFQMMPAGPQQEQCNQEMRARTAQGESVFGITEASEQWEQLKDLWGYDADNEVDDWWVKWGLLRERAKQRLIAMEAEMNTARLRSLYMRA
ncbi:FAD/NAD(P)-binding domain-containing protein, partial [Suillus weaverae]